MAEGLTGSLGQMSLTTIVRMLCASGQDGMIEFTDGLNRGELFLAAGTVVHAEAGAAWGEDAFAELLGWSAGQFHFQTGLKEITTSIDSPLDPLIARCTKEAAEMEEIRRVIPSVETAPRLFVGRPPKAVTIQPDEWLVLALIDGSRTLSDIAERLDCDDRTVSRAAYALVTAGVVTVGAEAGISAVSAPAGPLFFKTLTRAVAAAMGPLAEIIIDDAVDEMGETRETFPKTSVSWLAERISSEILDPSKRVRFQAVMLDELRALAA
jgi:hypothetical protein